MAKSRPLSIALLLLVSSCTCGGDPLVTLFPVGAVQPTIDFGPRFIGAAADEPLTFASQGTAPLHIESVSVEGASFTVADVAPLDVPAGETHRFIVTFSPTDAAQAFGAVHIETDAENGPVFDVELRGLGLEPLPCPANEACREYSFDPNAGVCVEQIREGGCDDGSSCTTNDHCDAGTCVGEAVVCPTLGECGRGVCDAQFGCFNLPDASLCDDDEPCTVDTCSESGACSQLTIGDGEPCGRFDSCHVGSCVAGSCTPTTLPDGVPCDDRLLCTANDVCEQGLCVGVRSSGSPVPAAVASTFGAGEEFLFPDPDGQPNDVAFLARESHAVRAAGGVLGVVATAPGPVSAAATLSLARTPFGAVGASIGSQVRVTTYSISGATFTPLGSVLLPGELNGAAIVAAGTRAFASGRGLHAIDLSDPASPVITATVPTGEFGFPLAVGDRLFTMNSTGFVVFDTTGGTLTPLVEDSGGRCVGLALADAGVLLLRAANPDTFIAGRLEILDPTTAAVTASIDLSGRRIDKLVAHHNRAALFGNRLELIALPGGNVLDSVPLEPLLLTSPASMSSSLLIASVLFVDSGGSLAFDIAADVLRPITGPAHGRIGLPTRVAAGQLIATSATSARQIDLTDPSLPTFTGGGQNNRVASLYRVADGSLLTAPYRTADATSAIGPLAIVDISDIDHPTLSSARNLNGALSERLLFPMGDLVVSLSGRQSGFYCDIDCTTPDGRLVAETFAISTSPPLPYPRLGGAVLPVQDLIYLDPLTMDVDRDSGRIAGVLAMLGADLLVLADAQDPTAPRIYPPLPLSHLVLKVALQGDRLYAAGYGGLEVFDVGETELVPAGSFEWLDLGLPDDGLGLPLIVDGETLVIGFDGLVVFFDVTTLPPRLTAAVPVAIRPLAAVGDSDHLILSNNAEIMTLTPACPPP